MAKSKSSIVGFILAIFTGPFSYLYIKKWKKTLLFIPLLLIPIVNAVVYIFILFNIISDVKAYNKQKLSQAKNQYSVCQCGALNQKFSRFCSECGNTLTKECISCGKHIGKNDFYCNYCGNAFKALIKTKVKRKKLALIATVSVLTMLLFSLTFLVAEEQHEASQYLDEVELVNFEFRDKISINKFHIHFELSDKRLPSIKGLKTYITGDDVYTLDDEAIFDGRNIEWVVHAKRKGNITFNVALYNNEELLDSRQFSVDIV
jgi:hypothetical protein